MSFRQNGGNTAAPEDQKAGSGETLPSSPGLGPKDAPEQRHSIEGKTSVPEAIRVMTQYFAALNARDIQGMAELCQFPFVSIEEVTPVVVKTKEDLISHAPSSMNMSEDPVCWTNNDSFIKHGSYDTLDDIEILAQDPYAVNLSMVYNRYGSNGKMLLQCEGVYCVTCSDGHWGIELMSTIFTPAPLVGWHYPETEQAALQARSIHSHAPDTDDCEDTPGENSDSSINIQQSGGDPISPADPAKDKADWHWYRAMYEEIEPGRRGFVIGSMPYSYVIHANADKAHVFSGLTRYIAGDAFDTSSEMSIVTWRSRGWGKAGAGAYITMRAPVDDIVNAMA